MAKNSEIIDRAKNGAAEPAELVRLLQGRYPDLCQTKIGAVLGVAQGNVSGWLAGQQGMMRTTQ